MPLFSILLPVHRPPALLPFAIESVKSQDQKDFELYVICDGSPPETTKCALEYAEKDSRIKVLAYPKGKRHGEAYRHEVLEKADSTYVCQIADDDIWFPNHLAEMENMLQHADFGHFPQVYVVPPDSIGIRPSNLADENQRRRMCEKKFNMFGPSECGYRMSAYRKLPEGWSPAPDNIWSDLYMWRKFFGISELIFVTRYVITSLHFPSSLRKDMSLQQRAAENEFWFNKVRVPAERDCIVQQALRALSNDAFKKTQMAGQVGKFEKQIESLAHKIDRLGAKVRSLEDVRVRLNDEVKQLKKFKNYYQRSRLWNITEFVRRIRRAKVEETK